MRKVLRILIVDDHAAGRLYARAVLEAFGIACEEAESATEALVRLDLEQDFDVVFSDIDMPGLSGLALLDAKLSVPVVLVSARLDDPALAEDARARGGGGAAGQAVSPRGARRSHLRRAPPLTSPPKPPTSGRRFDPREARMARLDEEEQSGAQGSVPLIEKALYHARTILLTGGIDEHQARRVCERLLALSGESDAPITLVVSSPGGHVESGDMIHDMIQFVPAPVRILGTGWVASAGALIYSAAPRERRFCLPNTRFLLHEPRGGVGGAASDVEIQAKEILKMRERLNKIFAAATGQPLERIKADTDRDYWMSAEDAVAYGLVGKIVRSRAEIG
jgi:ATP-dependent Clp protease protease subunit